MKRVSEKVVCPATFLPTLMLKDVYQYDSPDIPCVLPQPNFRPIVILPSRHMKWMLKLPDSIVSSRAALSEQVGIPETVPGLSAELESPVLFKLSGLMVNTLRFHSQRKIELAEGGQTVPCYAEDWDLYWHGDGIRS